MGVLRQSVHITYAYTGLFGSDQIDSHTTDNDWVMLKIRCNLPISRNQRVMAMRIKPPVLFIVLAVFLSSNAIAGAGDNFEIIEIKTYENMLGQRSASVTVRNSIEQFSRLNYFIRFCRDYSRWKKN